MNIITFRVHTQFNSIFPVVKIISEWLASFSLGSSTERGNSGDRGVVLKEARKVDANRGAGGWYGF